MERSRGISQERAPRIVEDLGLGRNGTADSFQNGHPGFSPGGVVAQHGVFRAGAQDSDGTNVLFQRKQSALIFQKGDALPGNIPGQGQMFRRVHKGGEAGFIGIGIIKQAQQEFDPQNPPAGPTDGILRQSSAAHQLPEPLLPLVVGVVIELQIHTGFQAHGHGLPGGIRHKMPVIQPADSGKVGADKATHAPLIPEDFGQQLVIGRHRNIIDGIVGATWHPPRRFPETPPQTPAGTRKTPDDGPWQRGRS